MPKPNGVGYSPTIGPAGSPPIEDWASSIKGKHSSRRFVYPNMNDAAIHVDHLTKRYSAGFRRTPVQALSDISLDVERNEIFGLLGPNGAGKTTLIKILLGSLLPTSGAASINGFGGMDWQSRLSAGYLPENHRFPPYLTGRQMLFCFGGMAGLSPAIIREKADALFDLVGLSQWQNTKIRKYSKGMMQRLGLAQALLNDPQLIFLDEPTDGVDPVGRHEIRTILLNLKKQGKTIFLNSHLLAEVEAVCDRVAILNKGKLVKIGPVSGLLDVKPAYRIETVETPQAACEAVAAAYPTAKIEGTVITLTLEIPRQINDVIDLLRCRGVDLVSVAPVKISLEESFLELIQGVGKHE
jgi:ABC-2 type transport system ATP-binding protein